MVIVYPIPSFPTAEERLSERIAEALRENLTVPDDLAARKLVDAYKHGKAIYLIGEDLREFAQSTIPKSNYKLTYITPKNKDAFASILGIEVKYVRTGFCAIVDGGKEFYGTTTFVRINPVPGSVEAARAEEAKTTKIVIGVVAAVVAIYGVVMAVAMKKNAEIPQSQ